MKNNGNKKLIILLAILAVLGIAGTIYFGVISNQQASVANLRKNNFTSTNEIRTVSDTVIKFSNTANKRKIEREFFAGAPGIPPGYFCYEKLRGGEKNWLGRCE